MRSDRRDVKPKVTIPIVPDQIESQIERAPPASPPPAPRPTRRELKQPTIPVTTEEIVESHTKTRPPPPPPKKRA